MPRLQQHVGLLSILVLIVLAAALSPVAAQEPGEQIDASPASGQQLRLAGPVVLESLDPAFAKDLPTMFLIRQVFAGLMRLDADLRPVPAIADSVEISDDGLTYRFVLNENARFFDGSDITADDAAYSLTRALSPATADGDAGQLAAPTFLSDIAGADDLLAGEVDTLRGVQVIDERVLQITLARPRSTFLMRLASAPASIVDEADMGLGTEWWTAPNASGPFAIDEFVENDHLSLQPNAHFVLGEPILDDVRISIGQAAFAALTLYEEDIIDVATVDLFNVERVMDPFSRFSSEVVVTPQLAVEYIAFRTDVPPLDDVNIRKALLVGFPRDRVAGVSFNGRVNAAGGLIPDGMMGRETWPVSEAEYQPALARQLIEQSRYGSAEQVPVIEIYAATPERAESLRDFVGEELGLRIRVHAVEWVDYLDGLSQRRYPSYLLYWGADYPDPETFLLTLFGSDSPDNYVDYSSDNFDTLLDAAALEADEGARSDLYAEAGQQLIENAVVLPIYYDIAYTVVKPSVQDLAISPLGILYLDETWIAE